MKGILLVGGNGTRLYPASSILNKQLLPLSDRPILFYSLTTLMLAGIREVLVITRPADLAAMKRLLSDGSGWGMEISFAVQEEPRGIADALLIGRSYVGSRFCLALGDNVFLGEGWAGAVASAASMAAPAVVLAHRTGTPERFGVVELAADGSPLTIEEKPAHPRSDLAVPGVYFYGREAIAAAECLQPSARGELEISDINRYFLQRGELMVYRLDEGSVHWFDTGTSLSYRAACGAVFDCESSGSRPGCPEEVALRMGFIGIREFESLVGAMPQCDYRAYLEAVGNRRSHA